MSAQDKVHYYISQVDKELSKYPLLVKLESQTQVPKSYAVLSLGFVYVTLLFFNVFAGFLSNFVGWLIPAYFSLKALESPQTGDDVQWLTYWTVFGFFNVLENLFNPVTWFPYYFVVKTVFIIWLILPSTKGAQLVYHKLYRPVLTQARAKTDTIPVPAPATEGNAAPKTD